MDPGPSVVSLVVVWVGCGLLFGGWVGARLCPRTMVHGSSSVSPLVSLLVRWFLFGEPLPPAVVSMLGGGFVFFAVDLPPTGAPFTPSLNSIGDGGRFFSVRWTSISFAHPHWNSHPSLVPFSP